MLPGKLVLLCKSCTCDSDVKLGYKRIMLFTCNDNPHDGDAALQRQAASKAEDLHQNAINVELMHMNTPTTVFDVNAFYKVSARFLQGQCTLSARSVYTFYEVSARRL